MDSGPEKSVTAERALASMRAVVAEVANGDWTIRVAPYTLPCGCRVTAIDESMIARVAFQNMCEGHVDVVHLYDELHARHRERMINRHEPPPF